MPPETTPPDQTSQGRKRTPWAVKDLEALLGAATNEPPGKLAQLRDHRELDASTYATLRSTLMLDALLAMLGAGTSEEGQSGTEQIIGLLRELQASNAAILQAQTRTVALLEEILELARGA